MPGHTDRFADDVFAAVAQQMLDAHPDDESGRMLHSPGLRTGEKFYGFATVEDLVVKLPAPRVAELVAAGDGLPCSPRPGRPMREWVCIPAPDEQSCLSYLREARTFVSTGGGAAYSR